MPQQVREGQVWASNKQRDIDAGKRQRRRVVELDRRFAFLRNEDDGRVSRMQLLRGGLPDHRLIEDAPSEPAARERADEAQGRPPSAESARFLTRRTRDVRWPTLHREARRFAELLREPVRSGVIKALGHVPEHRAPTVVASSESPWVHVDQMPGPQFVVWRESGEVFEVGDDGTVGEEPVA